MFNIYFQEWPLILFTILSQITIGLSFALKIHHYKYPEDLTINVMKPISFILTIMMGFSLILSCFHLSNVFAGIYTLTRIFDNWLPKEVMSLGLFSALSGLLFLLIWSKKANNKHISLVINILPILAILGLISMSSIYGSMSSTVVSWNFKYIILLFLSVSMMLGGLAFSFMPITNNKYIISYKVSLAGFLLFAFILPMYMVFLGKTEPINLPNIFAYASLYLYFLAIGLIFTIVGIGIMLFKGYIDKTNILIIFILVLIGQLIIRVLFYSLINTHLM